jgi:hypothetical protein
VDFGRQEGSKHSALGLDEFVAGYRRAGFTGYWVCDTMDPAGAELGALLGLGPYTPDFDRAYVQVVRAILEHGRRENWPDFCFKLIDEPGGQGTMGLAQYYYDLLGREVPEVRTFANVGPWNGDDDVLGPLVDIVGYNISSREAVEKCRQWGKEYWLVNQGSWGRDAELDRLGWGLYTRKNGARAMFHWVYIWFWNMELPEPGKELHPSFMYVVPAPDGPVPTLAWEGVREGIDDMRYILTLSAVADRAAASDRPELQAMAGEARALLDRTLQDVPVDFRERQAFLDQNSGADYDARRLALAREIIRLQDAL